MALAPGTRLGAYEILSLIGVGGMGEVYRARDTRLKRDVAIKVLPDPFANDAERLARFQREAELLATLNHPNIAQIHGLEDRALILELVDGPTLADRIARGPLQIDEALPIAKQIAEALEAAHERGIIHRDLKPANVKLTVDGKVKVLDFGLARLADPSGVHAPGPDLSQSPTITSPAMMTMGGLILGTAAYMSPEQARGKPVDRRSDIWAFGCVLYEMLTGNRAFEGEDVSDTLAAVLRGTPDWTALPSHLSPTLAIYLRRCLTREPAQRVHDIADVRLALEGAFDIAAEAVPPPRLVNRISWRLIAMGTIAVAAVFALLGGFAARGLLDRQPSPVARLSATPLKGLVTVANSAAPDVAVSADGSLVAYVNLEGRPQLYVRPIDRQDAIRLEGINLAMAPFFSPDGQSIGYFDQAGGLKQVSAHGGASSTIAAVKGLAYGGSWGSDGSIIFATNEVTGLLRVPASGGVPTVLTKPSSGEDHVFPEVLPGGRAVLFTILTPTRRAADAQLAVLDLISGTQKILVSGTSYGRYAASGHLVYAYAGSLRAVGFDLNTLTIRGTSVQVVDQVVTKPLGAANFALSLNGSLVYESGPPVGERVLVWVDRQGREEVLTAPKRAYAYPRISPDGTRIALDIRDRENDIWVWDGTRLSRVTSDPGLNRGIAWMPDGKTLVFSAQRDGTESIFKQAADGSGSSERLTQTNPERPQIPYSVTSDGNYIVFGEPGQPPYDLYTLQLGAEGKVAPLLSDAAHNEHNGEVSPNRRWLVFQSDQSGTDEIYVRPFPNARDNRWQVSSDGGTRPVWARNGRELFYLKLDGTMVAVPIQSDGDSSFSPGTPKSLFQGSYAMSQAARTYDVSPDGSRFLMIKEAPPTTASSAPQLWVWLNAFEELKRLVPVN